MANEERKPGEMESAMGGTSDAETAGDEAHMRAQMAAGADDEDDDGEDAPAAEERRRVLRETREAGQRAQGGGHAHEADIERAAREE